MTLHHNDSNQGSNDDDEGPVTSIVTRKAKKGKIREFEEWMDRIIHEAMKFALFNLGDISQKFVLNITSEHPKI